MAPASNEEQFKFLISCIRYSNNGKVDFGQVAKECKIVSKGAAAKRYERMMRAHGIAPNAASIKPATASRAQKSERRDSGGSSCKKRKANQFLEENPTDDDEGYGAGNIAIKPDPVDTKENFIVKEEEQQQQGQLDLEQATNLMQYYDNNSQYGGSQFGGDDSYGANEYGGGMSGYGTPSGYATPMGAAFGLQSPTDYCNVPYGSAGMSGSGIPRSQQGFQYQPALQYQSEGHGRSDSPVIVE